MSVPKPKRSRSRRWHRRFVFGLMAAIFAWAGWTVSDLFALWKSKAAELERLEERLREAERQNEAYRLEIARMNDDAYLEQWIRSRYHYAKPGETVYYKAEP
ncbi:MAG: hypothetical protein BLM47_03560 [Candidatus Reconcilbacillus cellulovorans]|uniref:Septum formation initiator n=1 Tax=Candidatus Reconcilbacillus cellulovorans TaxID=1906605 RepID=A0A2A6E264_9BACL|nr:MAG: hypothetical protein BLM47_03560 [Candidatus Reconcilbacillus cellulovorans]